MKNLCVVIPTHERHQYLARCIDYYSNFDCRVIVCDSSAAPYHSTLPTNVAYYHLPGQRFEKKILFALSVCAEDFIALSPDDDFLFEKTLYSGLDILNKNANIQACVGDVLGFPDDLPFRVVSCASGRNVICKSSDNPALNIENYLFNYHQILWALFRRDVLSVSYLLIEQANFDNENFFELTIAAISAGKGGIHYLENDWILRELSGKMHWGSKHQVLTQIKKISDNPDAKKFKQLVDRELFNGAAELALNAYLNGQKKNKVIFMQRVVGKIYRVLKSRNNKFPILPEVMVDQRFDPMIKVIKRKGSGEYKRSIIFADSYLGLRYLLCLIEDQIIKNYDVTVVSIGHPLYEKLLNYLNVSYFGGNLNILNIDGYEDNSKSRLKRFILSFVAERRYLRDIYRSVFSNISDCEIYFTARKHMHHTFHWIKLLSRSNKIYLLDADPTTNEIVSRPNNFTEFLIYFKWRIIYDFSIEFKRGIGVIDEIFGQIGGDYIRKYRINILDIHAYKYRANEILSKYTVKEGAIKVLLIDQDIGEAGMLNTHDFEDAIASVNFVLSKYFKNSEIAVKRHPFFPHNHRFSVENKVLLEAWMPAELLMSESVKFAISFHSNTLKISPSNVCAISLMDLLPFKADYLEQYKTYLLNSPNKKIFFPKNIEDFEKLIFKNVNKD